MASRTKRTDSIRRRKQTTQGKKRKAALQSKGTTRSPAELFGDKD